MELVVPCVDGSQVTDGEAVVNYMTRIFASIAIAAGFALTAGCANDWTPREIPSPVPPQPTPEPAELSFPDDDSSHDAPIEWWYYNGHLEAEDGSEYSFHFVIFQTNGDTETTQFEFGQAGITDVQGDSHLKLSSSGFGSFEPSDASISPGLLGLDLDNFSLDIASDGTHSLRAADASDSISIRLKTAQPREVMLHEGIGWMDWPFGWTYYYSYPRIEASGVLMLDGEVVPVSGEVWFDHQWGDFFVVGKPAGWQWFALHLNDGASLMISEVRGADGDVIAVDGTLLTTEGSQHILDPEVDGIYLEVTDHWTSPETGGVYPAGWDLQIESTGLDVVLSPSVTDQEVPAMPYGNQVAAYWEGRVDVFDASSGDVVGVAFAELSGYVDPEPLLWRDGEK